MADLAPGFLDFWRRWLKNSKTKPGSPPDADMEMTAEAGGSQPQDLTDDTSEGFWIASDNFDGFPPGWPLLARQQNYYHNGSLHRRFGALHERVLMYEEVTLSSLEQQLLELDKKDDGNASDRSKLRSLSPAQMRSGGKDIERVCEKDELIQEIKIRLKNYFESILQGKELRQLPRVSGGEIVNLYYNARDGHGLDREAMRFLRECEDFVTPRTERLHNRLEWLIFGDLEGKQWYKRLLLRPFVASKVNSDKTTMAQRIPQLRVKLVLTVLVVLISSVILLSPVLILYFSNATKAWSAGVVLLFVLVFTTIMATLPNMKIDTIFIALSAYMAVMVTFLANFQGGQCQC
ncbi:hypothetical protein B0H63DRAFT_525471 [Podospora didyma]|uniref:DUF6594 domain-containing protein n=1 Tax=Podospora didyma TaxID=330526 RepID=A0AAE0KKN5_9PEZI|nr:hypothetical protein B0H63DRAFT_525471 [Podospora didyma]